MPGAWADLTRDIQLRIFEHVAYDQVDVPFPEPAKEEGATAVNLALLGKSTYNPAVRALWQHISIVEKDLNDPNHGRVLDRLLRTIDACDPAVDLDGALPPAQYVECISYSTTWKTSALSRAQRDLAHLIRLCPNLHRLRLDGITFHLPTFFTTLTQNVTLTELRLENLARYICAEDVNAVLASQPKLRSFRLISDYFEEDYIVQRRTSEDLVKRPCPELRSLTLSAINVANMATLLQGCELPALQKADICLPACTDGGMRPHALDFLSALPDSLEALTLTEEGRCYDSNGIDWSKIADALPHLKKLRSNLSTGAFCTDQVPFKELVDLDVLYPLPSPLSFLRCLKDETWMASLKRLQLECWSGSPGCEHIDIDGVTYIKEKGEVPGVLLLHQIDLLDQQALQYGAKRANPVHVQIMS